MEFAEISEQVVIGRRRGQRLPDSSVSMGTHRRKPATSGIEDDTEAMPEVEDRRLDAADGDVSTG